jgi:hypothetical protein
VRSIAQSRSLERFSWIAVTCVAALLTVVSSTAGRTRPTNTPPQAADAILWQDPGAIESRDLFWGSASKERAPQPPFKFLAEKLTGTTAKVVVEDARGQQWDVKLAGEEAHGEVITNRLLWALGYPVEEMYFVHEGTIQGATNLKRANKVLSEDGRFGAARFRRRDDSIKEVGAWAFATNPFVGRRELSGLIILMALVNNWDTADDINKEILLVQKPDGTNTRWYIVADLGASFGRFKGPQGTPIKWSLADYEKDPLVQRVEGDTLILDYQAFGTPPTKVPVEHARWFSELIGRLSDEQIIAAFKAGGATDQQTQGFVRKFKAKLAELKTAVGATSRQ